MSWVQTISEFHEKHFLTFAEPLIKLLHKSIDTEKKLKKKTINGHNHHTKACYSMLLTLFLILLLQSIKNFVRRCLFSKKRKTFPCSISLLIHPRSILILFTHHLDPFTFVPSFPTNKASFEKCQLKLNFKFCSCMVVLL